jgi:hypothetical protein
MSASPTLSVATIECIHAARVPTSTAWPSTYWVASIDEHSAPPTPDEIRALRSYIEYVVRLLYNDGYAERVLAKPLPACGGHNTTVFLKRADGGWAYRRASWNHGPTYVPVMNGSRLSLVQVMDRCENGGGEDRVSPRWEAWKIVHRNVFAVMATAMPVGENEVCRALKAAEAVK